MTNRDDFSAATKKALAERSGFRCSYLGCPKATIGPSQEADDAVARTGVACHITAAAPGGKRYDSTLTSEQRSSISNGIWMCQTHSVEIDRDEARYTTLLLKHWKQAAETRADVAKNYGWDYFDKNNYFPVDSLADINVNLEISSNSNNIIGNAIVDSCLPQIWGNKQLIIIRDLIIEVYRNAFQHGNATKYNVEITANKIEINYNGCEFNIFNLLSRAQAGGGSETLKSIIDKYNDDFAVNYSFDTNNIIVIHRIRDFQDLLSELPCIISLNEFDDGLLVDDLSVHEKCGALYFILPMHFCRSDVRALESQFSAIEPNGKPVFIVGSNVTDNTREAIIQRFPNFTFVHKKC
ncbi:hypothetical protein Q7I18_10610 [Aeromonas veronii]|uniref:hypothetical protein n=1 Tax=Aeromonas veronii TaxID=654 RepID=UPI0030056468